MWPQVRVDGQRIPLLLASILELLPLDQYVEAPAALMDRVPADKEAGLKVRRGTFT